MLNQGTYATRVLVGTVVWTVGIIVFGTPVQGGFVNFNPTGDAAGPVFTIGGIDIAPGNALARGAVNLTVGQTFQLDFQAGVTGFSDTKGMPFAPPGLNTDYQLTAMGSFTEVVTSLSSNNTVASFSLAPVQSPNSFFAFFYNSAVVAKSLEGTGFNVGTPILLAQPSSTLPSGSVFTGQTAPPFAVFDQFGSTNHYPGITTVSGSGTALSNADVTSFDPAFFKTSVIQLSFNTLLATPFGQVSPSMSFAGMPGVLPPTVPNLGAINGITGPDFQFEVDPNVSFTTAAIPEPTSIILAGLGFASIVCIHAWMKK